MFANTVTTIVEHGMLVLLIPSVTLLPMVLVSSMLQEPLVFPQQTNQFIHWVFPTMEHPCTGNIPQRHHTIVVFTLLLMVAMNRILPWVSKRVKHTYRVTRSKNSQPLTLKFQSLDHSSRFWMVRFPHQLETL